MKVCIVGASGKLGQYMIQHCLDRGYEVVGVCRENSIPKLDRYKDLIDALYGDEEAYKVEASVTYRDGRKGTIETSIHVNEI